MARRSSNQSSDPFAAPVPADAPPSYTFFPSTPQAPAGSDGPARSATQRASYQPRPSASQADGVQRSNTVNPTPGPGGRPLQRSASQEDRLAVLRRFDTVILVDDSASMQPLWRELQDTVVGLVERAAIYDTDGIDIQLLCDPRTMLGVKNVGEAREFFETVQPRGESTPTEMRVEELLSPYVESVERAKKAGQPLPKPLSLLVLTDGAADDPDTLSYVLKDYAERLDAIRAPLTQMGVQFIQIGNLAEATEALRALDDDMQGVRDMVDTVAYKGQLSADFILKCLLGAVNRRLDARAL